jgi:predicted acylesterase/phospholipase RssA
VKPIIRILMLGGLLPVLLFSLSCSTIDYELLVYDQPSPVKHQYNPVDDGDFIFAVAVSGGGSRAAVFSAAVMEELYKQVKLPDGRSIIDEIDYISSVSGGSLSMAYYCINKPNVNSSHTELYDEFFDSYRADMRRNLEGDLLKNLFHFYKFFLTSEETGLLLKQTFDKLYFNNRKFDELGKRQKNGWAPTLIMNGTVMDTGARFLFTTLAKDSFDTTPHDMAEKLSKTGFGKCDFQFGGDLLGITFCDDIGLSIGDMEISRGVAASASVPLLLGPVVLKNQKQSTIDDESFIHVSDGGINDNQGITTIMQLITDRLIEMPEGKYRGGLVIIIDSNQNIDPAESTGSVRGFKALETAERAMNISFFRGKAFTYISIMFMMSNDPRFKDITFVYISPYLADDPEISALFQQTPTRFKIDPDKADNLNRAAEIVVRKAKDKILDAYLPGNGGAR